VAHGFKKRMILLTQDISSIPFDLRHRRLLTYNPAQIADVEKLLLSHVAECISTVPRYWNTPGLSTVADRPVSITYLHSSPTISAGNPFKITVHARNIGTEPKEGYCSISFPDGINDLTPSGSLPVKTGRAGDRWCNDNIRLQYPIVEIGSERWKSGNEHQLTIHGSIKRKGLYWFYISASSRNNPTEKYQFDPPLEISLEKDQRGEPVYCAVIEVT
jgi:hypothetical protein